MKTKATTSVSKKASMSIRKAKRHSKTEGRVARSGRVPAAAIADNASAPLTTDQHRTSKKATIEALVRRARGATIADLTAATGWQAHSVRAALTGLRKAGHAIARERFDDGPTRYRIAEAL